MISSHSLDAGRAVLLSGMLFFGSALTWFFIIRVRQSYNWPMFWVALALLALLIDAVLEEISRLGDSELSYHAPLYTIATIVGLIGIWLCAGRARRRKRRKEDQ